MKIGVHFDSETSRVAHVDHDGVPTIVAHPEDGSESLQNSVRIGAEGALCGGGLHGGESRFPHAPDANIKTSLGSREPLITDWLERNWQAEGLAAILLSQLKQRAETVTHHPVDGAVLAYPLDFCERRKRALLRSARLADIHVLDAVPEPIAATVYYGLENRRGKVLTVHLGEEMLTVAILELDRRDAVVAGQRTDSTLAAGEWTRPLVERFCSLFEISHRRDPTSEEQTKLAEAAKATASGMSREDVDVIEQSIFVGEAILDDCYSRSQHERLTRPLLSRVVENCRQLLESTELRWADLEALIITGDAIHTAAVSRALKRQWPGSEDQIFDHSPERAIAFGAALLADSFETSSSTVWRRRSTLDIGFLTRDPKTGESGIDVAIPRNSIAPARKTTTYFTSRPEQQRMVFEIVQATGDGKLLPVGRFEYRLQNAGKNQRVDVTIGYDEAGLISVEARSDTDGMGLKREFFDEEEGGNLFAEQRELMESTFVYEV